VTQHDAEHRYLWENSHWRNMHTARKHPANTCMHPSTLACMSTQQRACTHLRGTEMVRGPMAGFSFIAALTTSFCATGNKEGADQS